MAQPSSAYQLSAMQAGMLGHSLRDPASGIDIEHIVIRFDAGFDQRAFIAAWQEVVARHAVLRTTFSLDATHGLMQQVLPHVEVECPIQDCSRQCSEDFVATQERLLADDRRRGFDVMEGPPWRLLGLRGAGAEHFVVWAFHHSILDGRSFAIVLREVFANYDALVAGKPTPQWPISRPYRDYIEWLHTLDLDAAERYWRKQLAGLGTPTRLWIEASRPSESRASQAFRHVGTTLSAEETQALESKARRAGVNLNTVLQAVWAVLLSRLSGESDVVFGATRACRNSISGSRDMVGLFINTLPVRVNVEPCLDLDRFLRRLREQALEVREFEHTPLNRVLAWSEVPRGSQLFESIVMFDTASLDDRLRTETLQSTDRRLQYIGQTNFPLALIAYGGTRLQLRIEYATSQFAPVDAERLLRYLTILCSQVALASDGCKVGDLTMLPGDERQQLLTDWNDTARDYGQEQRLHRLIERQAARTPDTVALEFEGQVLTYVEMNRRANQLARVLRKKGVGPDVVVGVFAERSFEMVLALVAILKAGGAYEPLDPSYPAERVKHMLEGAQTAHILAQPHLANQLPSHVSDVHLLDATWAAYAHEDVDDLEDMGTPRDLAYVIFTSGSTGRPKGAMNEHLGICNRLLWMQEEYRLTSDDRILQKTPFSFDVSVWEFFWPLMTGARLVIARPEGHRDPAYLMKQIRESEITTLHFVPSMLRLFLEEEGLETCRSLRRVICSGEALPHELQERFFARRPDVELHNLYGPTEAAVDVTYWACQRGDQRLSVPIGRPVANTQIYVLDSSLQPVPVGVAGELYIAGVQVGRGYIGRHDLTAERFVPDPFSRTLGARMYKTGDLVRYCADSAIEYLGRLDFQIKINGLRIELGEIEAAIVACPDVADAAVIAREDTPGHKRLVAYVVARQTGTLQIDALRRNLGALLPEYMVPAHFVPLDALPLNANGKLDRAALPAPSSTERSGARTGRAFTEPSTPTERLLAAVWADVLRLERIGVNDHFFDLGGDSILSIQVVARCRRAGLEISTRDLFDHPTIAELARRAARADLAAPAISAAPFGKLAALTPIQKWFFEHDFAVKNHWNQAFLFKVPDGLDVARLQQALRAVVEHHDGLRLRFRREAGIWVGEHAAQAGSIVVQRHVLSAEPTEKLADLIHAHCAAGQATLDIERGPLLHVAHFDLGAGVPGRLLLAVHHLAVDGVSWRILLEDIEAAYDCLCREQPVALPRKTASFQQWAARLVEEARSARVSGALATWKALAAASADPVKLEAIETLERDAVAVSVELTEEETTALLHDVPVVYRSQINDALLTGLAQTLQRGALGSSILIEMEGHGREGIAGDLDVSRTVGWFTTLFPVRLEPASDIDPGAALKAVKEQLRRLPHRGMSYGLIRYASEDPGLRAALSGVSRPQVLFNYLGQFDQMTAGSRLFSFADEPVGPWHAAEGRRTHPVEILAQVRNGRLRTDWITSEKQIPRAEVERLAHDYAKALRAIIAHCKSPGAGGRTPADFPLTTLGQSEIDELWRLCPGLEDAYPLTPMQRLFYVMDMAGAGVGLEQWQFRIDGRLAPHLLRQAFEKVIERHQILRTAFLAPGQHEPIQIVSPVATLPWRDLDWRELDDGARARMLSRELDEDASTGLDLTRPPLMRVSLLRLAEAEWRLVWTTHHLCIDGWSWPRLFKEISVIYAALEEQRSPKLDAAPSFVAYVGWLGRHQSSSEAFWKDALAGLAAPTPLPSKSAGASPVSAPGHGTTSRPVELVTKLPRAVTGSLVMLARANQMTLGTLTQGGWALLLAHYSACDDVLFGASFSGRPEELDGIETLIGPCVTNVPVRATFTRDEPVGALLSRLQRRQLDLNQHQYMPLDIIQSVSSIPWNRRLFDSHVVFQNYQVDSDAGHLGRDARITPVEMPESTNYALTVVFTPGDELTIKLIYDPKQLGQDTAAAIMADLTHVLAMLGDRALGANIGDVLAALPAAMRGKAIAVAEGPSMAVARVAPAVAPRGDIEHKLVAIWRQLLGDKPIGIDDNFFDIGGQSILLVRAHRLIEKDLGRGVPIVALLRFPTIRALAAQLAAAPSGPADGPTDTTPAANAILERARKRRDALSRQPNRGRPG